MREQVNVKHIRICPLCFGTSNAYMDSDAPQSKQGEVECTQCGCNVSAPTLEEALAKWDRRPTGEERGQIITNTADRVCDELRDSVSSRYAVVYYAVRKGPVINEGKAFASDQTDMWRDARNSYPADTVPRYAFRLHKSLTVQAAIYSTRFEVSCPPYFRGKAFRYDFFCWLYGLSIP